MVLASLLLLFILLVSITPVRERAVWHLGQWRTDLFYKLNPPEEAVFVPQDDVVSVVESTYQAMTALAPTATPQATQTLPIITATATPQPTPLPASVNLDGVRYMDQHGILNYCAPATLAMGLSYWGWQGDRTDPGSVIKPNVNDKNVMPYEMADYVLSHTDLSVVHREGGTLALAKTLLANGFPVLIEKGAYIVDTTGTLSWMGHYNLLTGYDDTVSEFIVQDSYYKANYRIKYDLLESEWRSFNYTFLVIYPPNEESRLVDVLGEYADPIRSYELAAQIASNETVIREGVDQFFAYFNRGTSLKNLQDYAGAAAAYDEAYRLYPALPTNIRPWRITWYQTGPYFAYYYTNRFQDVLNLANTTLGSAAEPNLEESLYWRARALIALGDTESALKDLRTSLEIHPGFTPSSELLLQFGYNN